MILSNTLIRVNKMRTATVVGLICLLSCSLPPQCQGAQILGLFPHPGKSHFDFFRPLFQGLAEVGHNVTVASYFPNKTPIPNYTDMPFTGMTALTDIVDVTLFETSFDLIPIKITTFFMLHGWGMMSCETAFNSDVIKQILSSSVKYDVVILEQFNNDCMMAIAHLLDAPVISLSSCSLMPWHYQRMGSPAILSFLPMNFLPHTQEMTFLERLNNFVHFHAINLLHDYVGHGETNALIQKYYGSKVPPIEELVKKTSLMLINQHFSLSGAYPYSPSIVEVGGMQIKEAAPIEKNIQALLDSSPNGVIYISWGSMIRPESLPLEKRNAIFNVISKLSDYTFLMKWPNDTLAKPKNLHTRTWLQQRDILCHPNIKAFVAHAGLLGSSEAAYCGVPMLVTPFYGDQFLNAAAIVNRKLGVLVNYKDFTEKNIYEALQTILKPGFAQHAKIISDSYRNRPVPALNLSIWWVEHIMEHKGVSPLLKSASTNMNWFTLNSIDVYLFLIALALVLFIILKIILKMFARIFTSTKKEKSKVQ